MLYLVLMGGPGAGKGTQARLLEKALGLPQIASGDLFREHLSEGTDLGNLAKKYMDKGELVPDELTVAMVKERLSRPDCKKGALLDGFPRTINQAEQLDEILEASNESIDAAFYIHVDPEVLLQRLSGRWTCKANGHVFHELFNPPKKEGICDFDGSELYQREDDTVETQKRRITVYFEQTAPLLEYYQNKGLLIEIDGERSIDEIQKDMLKIISNMDSAAEVTQ